MRTLSDKLKSEWKYLGLVIKYVNNETEDIVVENDAYCIYFDRYNTSKPYKMTSNSTLPMEVVKVCYLTLKELNDGLSQVEYPEDICSGKVTWYDENDQEVEEEEDTLDI